MEFSIEIFAMLVIKSGKRTSNWQNGTTKDKIKMTREKETYKYKGIVESDTIKQAEMKENIKK